jgi:uncharacterized protein (DUF1015 family)
MAVLRPFRALRPRPEHAARVASVPYDVVDREAAAALAAGNPLSFLRVVRPEIDLPPATDPYADEVYAAGAAALARLVDDGVMTEEAGEALYLYRLTLGRRSQVGVVGCCAVDDYDAGRIKKHERTRPDKEEDRTRLALALGAHSGPVFLAYRGRAEIDRRVAAAMSAAAPMYDFVAADGVGHQVWRVADAAGLAAAFAAVPALYVADGHHRAAAASRARAARRAGRAGGGTSGAEAGDEADFFLAALFPADQLRILPYNRLVTDLNGLTPERFLARLGEALAVTNGARPAPPSPGRFSMYLAGRWYDLTAPPALIDRADPAAALDAAILQERVLGPLLAVDDPRTSDRIEFVGGGRGAGELVRRVDARPGSVAFSLHPVGIGQLMAVADAGRVLPPKSTWFEPKLRSGLLVHRF